MADELESLKGKEWKMEDKAGKRKKGKKIVRRERRKGRGRKDKKKVRKPTRVDAFTRERSNSLLIGEWFRRRKKGKGGKKRRRWSHILLKKAQK